MASVAALAHSVLLRVQGSMIAFWIVALSGGLMPLVVMVGLHDGAVAHVAFAIIAVLALCAAALLNHHTLTRSTSSSNAYRLPNMTPGMRVRSSM
jgi:hypothetical protein